MTETNAGQENNRAEMPASLGKMLSEARERLGLSVMDVSSQIKFAPRQIEALEADDYLHLPEAAFLRGFVRSYAKILHLDAQVLLAALPQKKAVTSELTPDSVEEPFPDIHSVLQHNLIWLGGALLLIVIVAVFALWHFTTPPEPITTAQVESPVTLPAETPVATPQPVPGTAIVEPAVPKIQPPVAMALSSVEAANPAPPRLAKKKQTITADTPSDTSGPVTSLRLEFSEEAWAEIKDGDGKVLSSRIHPAGSELTVNGHAPFSLLIGHATAVRLYYRDKQVDLVPHTRRLTEVASLTLE